MGLLLLLLLDFFLGGRSDFMLFFFFFCVALVCACFWTRARMMMMMMLFDMVPWEVICYDLIQELDEINQQQQHWQCQQCLLTGTSHWKPFQQYGMDLLQSCGFQWYGMDLWGFCDWSLRGLAGTVKTNDWNSGPTTTVWWIWGSQRTFHHHLHILIDHCLLKKILLMGPYFSFCLLTSLKAFLPSVLCLCLLLGVYGQLVNLRGSVYWVVSFLCLHGFVYVYVIWVSGSWCLRFVICRLFSLVTELFWVILLRSEWEPWNQTAPDIMLSSVTDWLPSNVIPFCK